MSSDLELQESLGLFCNSILSPSYLIKMCSVPPPPPPPPQGNANYHKGSVVVNCNFSKMCDWAESVPHIGEACGKSNICLEKPPYLYKYKHFESILQVGPTCGLVALSMLINGEMSSSEMLNICKAQGYSHNGEMLSCKAMAKLTEKVFSLTEIVNWKCTLHNEKLFTNHLIQKLLNGVILMVPYDADFNHSPCLRKGHTAHWALVCGIVIVDNPESNNYNSSNVYVLCRHGKSKYLCAWKLDELDKSNQNLMEFSPKKESDGLLYIIPEGGIGGPNGLCNQFLMFEHV